MITSYTPHDREEARVPSPRRPEAHSTSGRYNSPHDTALPVFLGDKQDGVVPAIYAAEELLARATHGAPQIWDAADDAVLAQAEATQPQQPQWATPVTAAPPPQHALFGTPSGWPALRSSYVLEGLGLGEEPTTPRATL